MATYSIKMLKDEQNRPFVPLVSTDCIRDENNQTLQQILDKKLSPANLLPGEHVNITTEGNNCYINVDLPANLNIINNLTTVSAGQGALDAYQGKVLKDSIPLVVDDLSSTSTTSALSANQGYVLNQKFGDYVLTAALENLVKQYVLASHPVGSIEINITGANPSTYLGGTWEQVAGGKYLFGVGGVDGNVTPGSTGGAWGHTHNLDTNSAVAAIQLNNGGTIDYREIRTGVDTTKNYTINTGGTGKGNTSNSDWGAKLYGDTSSTQVIPPYYAIYIWKRTA